MRILVFFGFALLTGCGANRTNPPGVHSKCGTWAEETEGEPFHPPPRDYYVSAVHGMQAENEGVQVDGSGVRCFKRKSITLETTTEAAAELQAEVLLRMERQCRHHGGNPSTSVKVNYGLSAVNEWVCIRVPAEAVHCEGSGQP